MKRPFVSFVSEHIDWGFCCVTVREDDQLVNLRTSLLDGAAASSPIRNQDDAIAHDCFGNVFCG